MGGGLESDRSEFARVIVLDKPAVRVTVFCFAILLFTTLRSNFLNPSIPRFPEDKPYARQVDDDDKKKVLTADEMRAEMEKNENIQRLGRVVGNNMENILVAMPTIMMSLIFCRSPLAHCILLVLYTVGRTGHTPAYKLGLQPWRALFFTLANFSILGMSIHAIIGAFWSV